MGVDVIETIRTSKFFTEITEQQQAAAVAHRRELVAELRKIEKDAEKQFVGLDKKISTAVDELRAAERALQAAQIRLYAARGERTGASSAFSTRHDELENQLRETASPLIGEFKIWINDELNKLCKVSVGPVGAGGVPIPLGIEDPITGRWREVPNTIFDLVAARRAALREATIAADELALEPDQSSVGARIQAIKDALPRIS